MPDNKSEILLGTLDLMVLKTLDAMGPLHGYGIARRIEQISEEALQIYQGTIYASLVRLMQKRRIAGAWGTSDLMKTLARYCEAAWLKKEVSRC
jgi:PadR family transcriptional regulator PadR